MDSIQYPGTLHAHTEYSNLRLRDCINTIDDLIQYAIELGHSTIAFTEHESVANAIKIEEAYDKIKKEHPDFKIIRGNEIYLCRDGLNKDNFVKDKDKYWHFILLAKDEIGHQQIRQLSTRAWKRSYETARMTRVPTYYSDLTEIIGANPGHVIGSTACFLPGQLVRTKNGDKKIEDITVGDEILTKDGKWEPINFPTNREYNDFGNKIFFTKEPLPVKCTKNHQFLVLDNNKKLIWKDANILKKDDKCLEPIPKIKYSNILEFDVNDFKSIQEYRKKSIGQNYSKNIFRLKDKIKITNEIMRLFGLWLADGHISFYPEKNRYQIGFSFSAQEFNIYYNGFVKQALKDFGLKEEDYSIFERLEQNKVAICINKVEFCLLFKEFFGISHAENKFIPQNILHISKDFDQELFFGYMLGDGYFRYRANAGGEVVAASISKQLIKDFEQLGLSLKLSGSIAMYNEREDKSGTQHKASYYLTYSNAYLSKSLTKTRHISHEELNNILTEGADRKKGAWADFAVINDILYRIKKVKSNEQIKINERVYCLNTNSHSFVLNNVIVHNCLGGFLAAKILQWKTGNYGTELYEKIKSWCFLIQNIFGKDNFYLEMQPSNSSDQIIVNKALKDLSKELNIPYIITLDAHYLKASERELHSAFLKAQDGERETDEFYATTYMMSTQELESFFKYFTHDDLVTAYNNIETIKNSCTDYTLKKPLEIPCLKWKTPKESDYYYEDKIPMVNTFLNSDFEGDKVLIKAIVEKVNSDKLFQQAKYYNEINSNLQSIWQSSEVNHAHWSAYLLNLQSIIEVCWSAGTLIGAGRGSGVGFLLLYLLGITQIDPLRETTKTFSWRFLNPSRVSVLDVDVDIEGGRREQVIQALRNYFGEERVACVATFGTEKSKQAVQTAARGLGLDNDLASYISSLIPADRGLTRTLKQCYYGDEENDMSPIPLFVQEMNNNPELWRVAQKIEGLTCRTGLHAGGIIFVTDSFDNYTSLMKSDEGVLATQFDLHDAEKASLIKMDLLSVEALDKIHFCLDLICDNNYETREPTLKATYEKMIGVYNLERNNLEMWQNVWSHKFYSLFQMEQQSGINGIAQLHPTSVDDLAILNSTIRLMAQEKGGEMPTAKLARFKANPQLWENEMNAHKLTEKEKEVLRPVLGISYGLCIAQEQFMELVQLPELGGFNLGWADRLRKSIAKKSPKDYDALTKEFFEVTKEKGINPNFVDYVWNHLIAMSRGYGFNQSHTLAYSLIALQEMNLCMKYPIIFWNCACLMTDCGGEDGSADYGKIATAINKMRNEGINISLPSINDADFSFVPEVESNRIVYGLKGLTNVGTDIVKEIIEKRPYSSIKDFYYKVMPKKQAMIALIKGGAFDELCDRKKAMIWYIWETCDKKNNINLQNLPGLSKYKLLPQDTEEHKLATKISEFNRYLNQVCKADKDLYLLDTRSINFLESIDSDDLINYTPKGNAVMSVKQWNKVYEHTKDILRLWINANKEEIKQKLNDKIFMEDWNKYALGTLSSWEMESLCFYYHEHELSHVNKVKYGLIDFFDLNEQPTVTEIKKIRGREIKIYNIERIYGTCIAKNKNKSTITLLTPKGVVDVKFSKDFFSMFNKRISVRGADGKKHIVEKSWFDRGNKLVIQGIRQDDIFMSKKYASTPGHQLYKINSVEQNGDLVLQSARALGEEEDEEE